MITKICKQCGKKFDVPEYRKDAKYCCDECKHKALHGDLNCECEVCGKKFHLKPYALKKSKHHTCSRECLNKLKSTLYKGEGNHQYGLKGDKNSSFKGYEIEDVNNNLVDVKVYKPDHIFADNSGRVLKHRLIVEENYYLFDINYFIEVAGNYYLKKGVDVHHKTIGILGMGRIGMALAQRAHFGFSMPVLYTSRRPHEEAEKRFNARFCSLDTLLAEVDFLCITLPMTEQTYHMIGRDQLAKMKSSAILINAGRGPVVDEQALIAALQDGTIHGAGLDVFEQEPLPIDSPLLSLRNVVAVPHIGSATTETRYNMAACAVDNLIAALTGTVTENCVNPQVLKK